jgi:hypothetical protein
VPAEKSGSPKGQDVSNQTIHEAGEILALEQVMETAIKVAFVASLLLVAACGQQSKSAISIHKACVKAGMKPYEARDMLGRPEVKCGIPDQSK